MLRHSSPTQFIDCNNSAATGFDVERFYDGSMTYVKKDVGRKIRWKIVTDKILKFSAHVTQNLLLRRWKARDNEQTSKQASKQAADITIIVIYYSLFRSIRSISSVYTKQFSAFASDSAHRTQTVSITHRIPTDPPTHRLSVHTTMVWRAVMPWFEREPAVDQNQRDE